MCNPVVKVLSHSIEFMKKLFRFLAVAGVSTLLSAGSLTVLAQDAAPQPPPGGPGGGGWDPAQMRQRMMERYREQFKIKDDAEWKLIEERIAKVTEARMAIGFRGGPGGFGGRGGRGPGGPGGGGQDGGGRRGGFPGMEPSAEAADLQKALEADAPSADIKAKLEKYRDSLKVKEATLEKSQEELRKVLTGKQEAAAVLAGLLK